MSAAPLLAVERLETAYGASQVLFGIDLEVRAGEVVGLLGRNGMGKTTLVRSILGLVASRAGRIVFRNLVINGTRVTNANCRDYFDLLDGVTAGKELVFE